MCPWLAEGHLCIIIAMEPIIFMLIGANLKCSKYNVVLHFLLASYLKHKNMIMYFCRLMAFTHYGTRWSGFNTTHSLRHSLKCVWHHTLITPLAEVCLTPHTHYGTRWSVFDTTHLLRHSLKWVWHHTLITALADVGLTPHTHYGTRWSGVSLRQSLERGLMSHSHYSTLQHLLERVLMAYTHYSTCWRGVWWYTLIMTLTGEGFDATHLLLHSLERDPSKSDVRVENIERAEFRGLFVSY